MEHSELFLLLPKYEEAEGQPDYIKPRELLSEKDMCEVIATIDEICRQIQNENYEGHYDSRNVAAFLYPVYEMDECYPNVLTRMRISMSRWGEDWRRASVQNDAKTYMYYRRPIADDSLCEIIERKAQRAHETSFLLVNCGAMNCAGDAITALHDGSEVMIDVRNAEVAPIAKWFAANRRPMRVFHANPKHGENGKGAHRDNKGDKVSRLLCSKEQADAMLSLAIGSDSRVLYFFDEKHGRYIEFKCERPNVYHGYHLDDEDENRVPSEIKAMIKRAME